MRWPGKTVYSLHRRHFCKLGKSLGQLTCLIFLFCRFDIPAASYPVGFQANRHAAFKWSLVVCVYARRESRWRSVRMWEFRDTCTLSVLGVAVFFFFFFFFGLRREEGKTGETATKNFVVPLGCDSSRIENAAFSSLHWFKRELLFNLFFLFGHSINRVAAVCFCYTHGERSVRRSHPSLGLWRKNWSYLLCCCLTSFFKSISLHFCK